MSQQPQPSPPPPWVLHRNREQPAPGQAAPPIERIKFYLEKYKIKEALQTFFDENTLSLLRTDSDFMWDVIPLICKRLHGLCQYRFRVFEGCERMLCRIAVDEGCNPKEVLISLLAELNQYEDCEDDNVFRALIRPLEGALCRLNYPSPRDENFIWTLNVLIRYVNQIELPQEQDLEGEQRVAFQNDPSVKRFIEILPLLLSFIEELNNKPTSFDRSPIPILTESLIDEVLNGELVDDDLLNGDPTVNQSESLNASVNALQGLMVKPLAHLDLTTYCTDMRQFANKCLSTLLRLFPNLFNPIYKRTFDKSTPTDSEVSNSLYSELVNDKSKALAVCSYIYRCEQSATFEAIQSFPQIMSYEHLLISHLPSVVCLIEHDKSLVHEKGLLLLSSLLENIKHNTLNQKFLDMFENSSLNKHLFKIMSFSHLSSNRKLAYNLFIDICDGLTYDCKIRLLKHTLTQREIRPDVRAACIDQYRKYLTNIYQEEHHIQQLMKSNSSHSRVHKVNDPNGQISPDEYCDTRGPQESDGDISEQFRDEPPGQVDFVDRDKVLQQQYSVLGGSTLVDFLGLCIRTCLPELQQTDIIENYDLLMATLILLRFLKLRKKHTRSKIEDEFLSKEQLKKPFFDQIRSAISILSAELKSKLNEVKTDSLSLDPGTQDVVKYLNWAMCKLSLIESILVQTCDVYNC